MGTDPEENCRHGRCTPPPPDCRPINPPFLTEKLRYLVADPGGACGRHQSTGSDAEWHRTSVGLTGRGVQGVDHPPFRHGVTAAAKMS